jgi:drug/metabolite transporter (DMT)-like permease
MAAPSGRSGLARIALASVLFGLSSIFIRLAYDHGANVAGVLTVRASAVLPWVAILATARHRASARSAWRLLLPMGLLAAINVTTFAFAVQRMSPALVALIYYAYPVLVIAGAHLLGRRPFETLTGLAATSTLLGVGLTIGLPHGGVDTLAVVLSLLNAVGYATYILFAETALNRATPAAAIAFVAGISSTLLLAGCLAAGPRFPSSEAGIVGLVALFCALFFPHVLMLSGISRLGGPWGSLVSCLEVVTTVVAASIILSLTLGLGAIVGGILILLGGLVAPWHASQRPTRDAVRSVDTPGHEIARR